ncbi:unnamed protein product [Pleuronectes platessa]|uniref:Protein S100 n=1 Tax=Pleuronectes platessa TaxID=8262 RepID=A0A9N7ZBP0_PLEPL|nr:unnamed protein product [Pleuronectes platessa]
MTFCHPVAGGNSATMSGLAHAISILTDTFEKHAGKDGDCKTLSKAELADLLRSEFPEKGNSNAVVDSFFSMLDNDRDGAVDFKEFVTFVTTLAVMSGSDTHGTRPGAGSPIIGLSRLLPAYLGPGS